MLIDRRFCQLLLIDIQVKIAPHVAGRDDAVANCAQPARYARRIGVPATDTKEFKDLIEVIK